MLRILGLRVRTGKNYEDIAEWGKRMTLTGISSEGVVYFAGRKIWATDTFHVFERFVSHGQETPNGQIADRNYVWLSDWQLENINSNYLLPIDFDSYRQLKNHIAKALVPLVQIWLYATREGGCFEKRYEDLCQILNMRQYPQLSKINEKLQPSLEELTVHGYLSNWEIRQTSDQAAYKVAFYHGVRFARNQREQTTCQKLEPSVLEVKMTPDEDQDVDLDLLAEMVRRGISENTARELLDSLAIGQQVMDQLEWGDHQIRNSPKKFYNPAGLYIHMIREKVRPPTTFDSSRTRNLREEAKAVWRKQQEDNVALELAYFQYKDQTLEKYIQKNYTKEFYASCVRLKLQELMNQDRKLKEKYREETLLRMAEKRLRQEIVARIPLLTLQEFCEQMDQKSGSHQQASCPLASSRALPP